MLSNKENKEEKESIFRKESLERLSSPERLDQLMQVIAPMDWLALTVLSSLVGVGLIWSIVGRIPVTVQGRGIFIQPRRIVDLQSSITGQLRSLNVRGSQCVKQGEVLGTVEPIDLQQQLQLARGKLAQLQAQAEDSISLSSQRTKLEKSAVAASRIGLEQRLKDTRAVTPILQLKGLDAIAEQRRGLEQRLKDAQILVPVMQKRLQQRKALEAQGVIPKDTILFLFVLFV